MSGSRAARPGGAAPLRVIASRAFVPRGHAFNGRRLARRRLRALRGGDQPLGLHFTVRSGEVVLDVLAREQPTAEDIAWAIEAGRGIAGVDDDPSAFLASVARHPVLGRLARGADPRMFRTPTVFEAYASAVIEQLVTGVESRASIARLWREAGEPIAGTDLQAAPTAAAVRRIPMWRMHEMGIGSRRAATLREGALRGSAIEGLARVDPEIATERLQSIRGVGPWTANAVARDALGYSDAVPIADFHAPSFVTSTLCGEAGDDEAMLAALAPYRPHRARVVLLIEHAFVRGSAPGGAKWRPPRVDPHRRFPWKY